MSSLRRPNLDCHLAARAGSAAADLGPSSLTWRLLGDSRGVLTAHRAGVLQAMHPAIAAGLLDHSDVFNDPIGRLIRSAGPILGTVFDEEPERTGAWIRDLHPPIRGRDAHGRVYHALRPDIWFWAHATFVESAIATQDLFGVPLSFAERQRFYAESVVWYSRYAVTMRPVPSSYEAFVDYWNRMFDEVLEPTSVALAAVKIGQRVPRPAPGGRAVSWWPVLEPLAGTLAPWALRGTLPRRARMMLGIKWTAAEKAAFGLLRGSVRTSWPYLPADLQRLPRAQAADRRVVTETP